MGVVLPRDVQEEIERFDEMRERLLECRRDVLEALPLATPTDRAPVALVLRGMEEQFPAAVSAAHEAITQWCTGAVPLAALRAAVAEPARLYEELLLALWQTAADGEPLTRPRDQR